SEDLMRIMIQNATTDGAMLENLVFITTPTIVRLFKNMYSSKEQLVPNSPRVGFKTAPEMDSVPIFTDYSCKAQSLFLLDLASWAIAIFVPPTVEKLGKRSDTDEFFIKSYYAPYCRAP